MDIYSNTVEFLQVSGLRASSAIVGTSFVAYDPSKAKYRIATLQPHGRYFISGSYTTRLSALAKLAEFGGKTLNLPANLCYPVGNYY
jgi:hypothetical protein